MLGFERPWYVGLWALSLFLNPFSSSIFYIYNTILYICISISICYISVSIYLSVCLSVCLSIYLFIYLSIHFYILYIYIVYIYIYIYIICILYILYIYITQIQETKMSIIYMYCLYKTCPPVNPHNGFIAIGALWYTRQTRIWFMIHLDQLYMGMTNYTIF